MQDSIPCPPGFDPLQQATISNPLGAYVPVQRRSRRKKEELLKDEYPDPESKWSEAATKKLLSLYAEFGIRKVIDQKLHDDILFCLKHNGNPAVTLMSPDGTSFFTYLTVASECGDEELVKKFLTEYREEFSDYDIAISLKGALQNRQQEIAEYLLLNTEVKPDQETIMEMFDIQMSDESESKIKPLRAFITNCLDAGRFPEEEFYIPDILNRCIYAHNVAALRVLFETKKDRFLPLTEIATPDTKVIKAGRAKSNDIGEGVPPLAYAAVMERGECLEVMLANGANPNFICNDMGGTLLHIVGFKGNTELIELLIEHDADPRIPNDKNVLPLTKTKGRKARKCITDAIQRLNDRDGIVSEDSMPPMPHHHHHPHHHQPPQQHGMDGTPPMRNNGMGMDPNNQFSSISSSLQEPIVLSEGTTIDPSFNSLISGDSDNMVHQMAQPPPFNPNGAGHLPLAGQNQPNSSNHHSPGSYVPVPNQPSQHLGGQPSPHHH